MHSLLDIAGVASLTLLALGLLATCGVWTWWAVVKRTGWKD